MKRWKEYDCVFDLTLHINDVWQKTGKSFKDICEEFGITNEDLFQMVNAIDTLYMTQEGIYMDEYYRDRRIIPVLDRIFNDEFNRIKREYKDE